MPVKSKWLVIFRHKTTGERRRATITVKPGSSHRTIVSTAKQRLRLGRSWTAINVVSRGRTGK